MATKGVSVTVKFPPEISSEIQGLVLLELEASLRYRTQMDVRVVKDLMGDDSKLRRFMTIEQRAKL